MPQDTGGGFLPFCTSYSNRDIKAVISLPQEGIYFIHLLLLMIFYLLTYLKMQRLKTHDTRILLAVFHECETLSLTLREEHMLRVFQNKVSRRIFGPQREHVAEDGENGSNKMVNLSL
jgi:hypothetical protein